MDTKKRTDVLAEGLRETYYVMDAILKHAGYDGKEIKRECWEALKEITDLRAENAQLRGLAYEALNVMENLRDNGPEQGDGFYDEHGVGGWLSGGKVREQLREAAADIIEAGG